MKIFFLASLLVSLSAHAAGPVIFSESFPVVGDDNSPETIAKEVIQTYADALAAKKPNAIQTQIAALKAKYKDEATIDLPDTRDLLLDSSSFVRRPSDWAGTFILGVPMNEKGNAFQKTHPIYYKVEFESLTDTNTEVQTTRISITGVVRVSGN